MTTLVAQIASLLARHGPDAGADAAFNVPDWAPHAVALFAFASGVALWLAGRSYLRLTFCLSGAAIGALSGFEVFTVFASTINPFIGAVVGLVIGALMGLVTFRFVVALALGAVGAIAATLLALAVLTVSNGAIEKPLEGTSTDVIAASPGDSTSIRDGVSDALRNLSPYALDEQSPMNNQFVGPVLADAAGNFAEHAAESASAFFGSLAEQVAPMWNDLPSQYRLAISGAAVLGFIIGLLGGFLLPSRSAAITTAFVGPAIWLPTGVYLLGALNVPLESWVPSRPLAWIGIWLAAATIGLLVQWTRSKPNSDKA